MVIEESSLIRVDEGTWQVADRVSNGSVRVRPMGWLREFKMLASVLKFSYNEHPAAVLRHSEVCGIQYSHMDEVAALLGAVPQVR